ncbi:hypothetical protein KIW84_011160 [Lathyrus oleraceus]|uniref:GH16 domain-containing protein n=1 Tax=Pisum sativum TaxID=3888 RepID=A0A9D4YMZ1_PEA|nr:hypothetical protein KIW84_011160 [Pisum sativum]
MHITWGAQHALLQGDDLQLMLDESSGSGAKSKKSFLFGTIETRIKLVPGNSEGIATSYYLSSTGNQRDEIDFEFIGNISGQPYTIHTNIFAHGSGNKEQQFYLWFDPTTDFHNYTIHWNPTEIVFYIDSIPIRVFRNYEYEGIAYPNKQGMRVYISLHKANNWATRGGLVKVDWSEAPFTAKFNHFRARACKWNGEVEIYEEQKHLQHTGIWELIWEIILDFHSFVYQYAIVYHSNVAKGGQSITVYGLSWIAFLPTGWALVQIAQALVVLAWFPFVSESQTRLLYSQAISGELQIRMNNLMLDVQSKCSNTAATKRESCKTRPKVQTEHGAIEG